ncbi:MAG: hypothetical protein Q7R99_00530 [bacterium]|nr:hypothetical protein [bacterium]
MENEKILDNILSDLYQIDPSFKAMEKELSALIAKLLENKPEIMINENFKQELKAQVLRKAEELKSQKQLRRQATFSWRFALRPVAYVTAGIGVVLLVAMPWMLSKNNPQQLTLNDPFIFNAQEVEKNSFGKLALGDFTPATAPEGSTSGLKQLSQSSQTNLAQNPSRYVAGGGEGISAPINKMMPYRAYNIIYTYKGDPVELNESQLKVYKRKSETSQATLVGRMFSNLKWEGLNFAKFSGLLAQYVTLKEPGNSGYSISLDFNNGMVSINQDMGMVVAVDNLDAQESISSLPPDDKVIAIANRFLAKYGINAANYGSPEVQKQWILRACRASLENRCYIPSSLSVIYPMLVNGQQIYDQGGGKVGMNITVDTTSNKVMSLWNLKTQNYQSSFYEAQTDFNKILEAIQKIYRPYYNNYDNNLGETIEVELGEPQRVYESITRYQNGKTEEFVVPALLFPVKENQASQYYYSPENIVVPLITEMLDFQDQQGPQPVPMPMFESGQGEAK